LVEKILYRFGLKKLPGATRATHCLFFSKGDSSNNQDSLQKTMTLRAGNND